MMVNPNSEKVALPRGPQRLTFGCHFDLSLEKVALLNGLQSLTFGMGLNQRLRKVSLPCGLLRFWGEACRRPK